MSRATIHAIQPKAQPLSERSMRDSVNILATHTLNPVVGWAMVAFHKDGTYSCGWDVTDAGIAAIDIPDMAAARLRHRIHEAVAPDPQKPKGA